MARPCFFRAALYIFMETVVFFILVLISAYILDLAVGDPEGMPHPVRWIGRLVSALEGVVRKAARTPSGLRLGGVLLALAVVVTVYVVSAVILYTAGLFSTILSFLLSVYMVWTCLSVKSLSSEAIAVVRALDEEGLEAGRTRVARIVGRDTAGLTRGEVLKATVETVSENTSDGVVAPLFYLAIGGPPLMFAYKAVNTLDSMVGYRNEKYARLGWFSARLDDAANYLPARIAAGLVVLISFLLGFDWKESARVVVRDGRNHVSPNAGLPEAAVAGALGLRLGGSAVYGGVEVEKPFIGNGTEEFSTFSVFSSVELMRAVSFIMTILAALSWAVTGMLPVILP